MFVLMKSDTSLKMMHVVSKTRSLGQILEKPCVHSRGHIFSPFIMKLGQIIKWCYTPLLIVFQSYDGNSSCLSWVSPVLGWGSEVSCPRTLPWKTKKIQGSLNAGPLYHTMMTFDDPGGAKEPFENFVGKGENADIQHFLLFKQCFLTYQSKIAPFEQL